VDIAPLGIHWCLAPATPASDDLLADGLSKRGTFLPPVSLPRSMWAGGRMMFHQPLRLGDTVTKVSRVTEITPKLGASGRLVFITVNHQFMVKRGVAMEEWQTIVFCDVADRSSAGTAAASNPSPSTAVEAAHSESVVVDPVLLFRYAALTFNSHRIHYDLDYARDVEGYPGLVVQGALQATLLLNLASRLNRRACPKEFSYRATEALFNGPGFRVCAAAYSSAQKFWIQNSDNRKTFSAMATW
jgi:3-methylfumaryl-CoA hydratase